MEEQTSIFSSAEVIQAAEDLSDADLLRLEKAAKAHMRGLVHLSRDRSADDLLQEAITRTLSGERAWKKGIDFVFHLDQVMRSICSSWRTSSIRAIKAGAGELSEAALAHTLEEGNEVNVLERAISRDSDPEQEALASERAILVQKEAERITNKFAGDRIASEVLAGWKMGLKGPEVWELSEFSEKEYRAAVRRIRRTLLKE